MPAQGQSFDYLRAQASALRLIDKFGQAGAIVRDVPGSGPEWDPGEPVATAHTCTMAVFKFDNRDIVGTLIKANDKKVFIAAKGLSPTITDKLMIGGVRTQSSVSFRSIRQVPASILKSRQEREVQRMRFTSTQAFISLIFNFPTLSAVSSSTSGMN